MKTTLSYAVEQGTQFICVFSMWNLQFHSNETGTEIVK